MQDEVLQVRKDDEIYENMFLECFEHVRNLAKRMRSNVVPIKDEELQWILVTLPLELFTVSESLNKLRLELELTKLDVKDCISSMRAYSKNDSDSDVSHLNEILRNLQQDVAIYTSVIQRVENEISFSRELIMGAKKVWDSRRNSEASNPVSEVVVTPELPDYEPGTKPDSYIR